MIENNNQLEKYIDETLDKKYTYDGIISETDDSSISLFTHIDTQQKLLKITSQNMNDDVFRAIKGRTNDNLPMIYEVCSAEGYFFVLEEYIEGNLLSDMLTDAPLDTQTALKYFIDVCKALSFLHSHSIVHRDIKPSNIIIDKNDNAVLIDLHAARLMSGAKRKDTKSLGTVGYAAPEQFGLYQSIPATDIYALGVLLNEMILSIHPTLQTPKGLLGKIINKCINVQISKRYLSINELMNALRLYITLNPQYKNLLKKF